MTDTTAGAERERFEAGWFAAISIYSMWGVAGWLSHKDEGMEMARAALPAAQERALADRLAVALTTLLEYPRAVRGCAWVELVVRREDGEKADKALAAHREARKEST